MSFRTVRVFGCTNSASRNLRRVLSGATIVLGVAAAGLAQMAGISSGMPATPSFIDSSALHVAPLSPKPPRALPLDSSKSSMQLLASSLGYDVPVFGLSFFRDPATTYAPLDQVAPASDYRISSGDALDVKVWGSVTMLQRCVVDASGQIFLPQVGAISVAGVRFGDLDRHLRNAISQQFRNFEVQSALARQKSLQIYVTGNARSPGAYTVGGFSSLVNALLASGGPTSNGSLRQIELRRGSSLVGTFDLYDLLLNGDKSKDFSLQSGDVIHIPSLKTQVAVVNGVVTPGIYEIKPGETLYDLFKWAGGLSMGVNAREYRRELVVPDSGLRVEQASMADSGRSCKLQSGDMFSFSREAPRFDNAVTLQGHVKKTGRYTWKQGMRVRDLLPSMESLIPDHFWEQMNRESDSANLAGISNDRRLDINWDYALIRRMSVDSMQVDVIPFNLGEAMRSAASPANLALEPGDVLTIFGAKDLAVPVQYRPVYVRLLGEVKNGGLYKMKFGQSLKDLLRQAGGLTPNAYLFGASLVRQSTKALQTASYKQMVDEMERQFESNATSVLSSAGSAEEASVLQSQVAAQRQWFASLKAFVPDGRLVLGLPSKRNLDIDDLPDLALEDGDEFTVPAPNSTISVFGEVSRQSGILYRKGGDVGDYLERAGGMTRFADDDQAFVIRADGSIVGESDYGFLFWQLSSMDALPGDAIVVPRKMDNTRWVVQLKDWSQILANFGLSAAAIVTLTK